MSVLLPQGVVLEVRGAAAGQQLAYRRAETLAQARRGGPGGGGGAAGDASAMEEDTLAGAGSAAIAQAAPLLHACSGHVTVCYTALVFAS